jgi:hypothetical protein
MPDTRTVKKIFNWKPLTKRSQWRLKYRWEDNIKQDICQKKDQKLDILRPGSREMERVRWEGQNFELGSSAAGRRRYDWKKGKNLINYINKDGWLSAEDAKLDIIHTQNVKLVLKIKFSIQERVIL